MRSNAIRIGIIGAVACMVLWGGSGIASAGGGCHIPPTTRRGDSVDIADLCFDATVLYVEPGTDVTWTNRDAMSHVVVGVGDSWGDPGISLLQGDTVSYRFDRDGVYPYSCLIHPGMVGAIVVGDGVGTDLAGVVPVAASEDSTAAASTSVDPAPIVKDEAVNVILVWIAGAALLLAGLGGGFAIAARSRRRARAVAG
jgi:plastocyanin